MVCLQIHENSNIPNKV